ADVRFNVSIAELSSVIQGQMDGDYLYLYGYAGLGLSLELLGLVDLGITAGPMLGVIVDTATGDMISSFDFEDPENMDLIVRATADVNLGGISVGGFVMVSPGLSIANIMDPAFDPSTVTVPTTATVGLSVLLALL
ncbi:MAG: hypothetical protein H8D65_00850, partial [Spirochaetes bacterium]|nr:hypothetical protein [Spirochaetota bacterium]